MGAGCGARSCTPRAEPRSQWMSNSEDSAGTIPAPMLDLVGRDLLSSLDFFNASGQTIDVEGLLCLFDADGPCANAVKDAQRTKASPATRRTLSVVWACEGLEDRLARATRWYRELLERAGARTETVTA